MKCRIAMIDRNYKIRDWIANLPKLGRITFSLTELTEQFSSMNLDSVISVLQRLVRKGKIISVWKGFYVVIPVEFELKGIVPPVLYMDQLMMHLKRNYYIGLLDAAAFYGAAHQRPQVLTVITELPAMRDKEKKGIKIKFVTKKEIPNSLLIKKKTKMGYINVSNPELTAIDLILYEKEIGGINRASTVLNELAEEAKLNFTSMGAEFLKNTPTSVIQRLGYILDLLEYTEQAHSLFVKVNELGIRFRRMPLKTGSRNREYGYNAKWKIIINEHIEIDE